MESASFSSQPIQTGPTPHVGGPAPLVTRLPIDKVVSLKGLEAIHETAQPGDSSKTGETLTDQIKESSVPIGQTQKARTASTIVLGKPALPPRPSQMESRPLDVLKLLEEQLKKIEQMRYSWLFSAKDFEKLSIKEKESSLEQSIKKNIEKLEANIEKAGKSVENARIAKQDARKPLKGEVDPYKNAVGKLLEAQTKLKNYKDISKGEEWKWKSKLLQVEHQKTIQHIDQHLGGNQSLKQRAEASFNNGMDKLMEGLGPPNSLVRKRAEHVLREDQLKIQAAQLNKSQEDMYKQFTELAKKEPKTDAWFSILGKQMEKEEKLKIEFAKNNMNLLNILAKRLSRTELDTVKAMYETLPRKSILPKKQDLKFKLLSVIRNEVEHGLKLATDYPELVLGTNTLSQVKSEREKAEHLKELQLRAATFLSEKLGRPEILTAFNQTLLKSS